MSRIRGTKNVRTEVKLIGLMRKNRVGGWRRKQRIFGAPDFVFREQRVAVFVDGCFWHFCPKHGRLPKGNSHYWVPKLTRNRLRDRRVSRKLRAGGWKVVRIWHHELANERRVVARLKRALGRP